LIPTCRVVYEDGTWLVMDTYLHDPPGWPGAYWNNDEGMSLWVRPAWIGNHPKGEQAILQLNEWVNPYPEKMIKELDFFVPEPEDANGRKAVSRAIEAILAITGVAATEQDERFWAARDFRTHLLQPCPKEVAQEYEYKTVGKFRGGGKFNELKKAWQGKVKTPSGPVTFTLTPHGSTLLRRYLRYDGMSNRSDFDPFSATLTFAKSIPMNRVDILGPMCYSRGLIKRHYFLRRQKISVKVEGSEDGKKWQVLGKVKGVSVQADFQPISFSTRPIKALRFTADTKGYSWDYPQDFDNGMFTLQNNTPHFGWRLFGPGKGK